MAEPYFNGPLAHVLRRTFPTYEEPRSAEEDAVVRSAEAQPLCLNCLFPHERHDRFCAHCGQTVGDFVPLNPYLQIFTMAEVARRGVAGPPERRVGVQAFLVVFSLCQYSVFAPVYWYWMVRRANGRPICHEARPEIPIESGD